MTYKTHIIGGVLLCVLVNTQVKLQPIEMITLYSSCILGSLLPDIDHQESKLGQFNPFPMKHRHFTHSLTFTWTVFAFTFMIFRNYTLSTGLTIGILSHLLLDMLNPSGVPLFYPYRKRYHIANIKTSGNGEMAFKWFMVGVMAWLIIGI